MCVLLFWSITSAFQMRTPNVAPRGSSIWYVNSLQTGIADGLAWETAFSDLQSAFDVATSGDQIWVATGTYVPTDLGGSTDSRDASFRLIDGVAIYGGFFGDEIDLTQRDPVAYPTILSGDVLQDDQSGGSNLENVRHVVLGSGTLSTSCILEGFVIRAGNADGVDGGGGLFVSSTAGPEIRWCLFANNTSDSNGGAIVVSEGSSLTIQTCRIEGNQAGFGGGVHNSGTMLISNSLISTNIANSAGGAFVSQGPTASLRINNCSVIQNTAEHSTGGVLIESGALTLVNSIVWGNRDLSGDDHFAQMYLYDDVNAVLITFSCIQNMNDNLSGSNNTDSNPRFVDQLGPDGLRSTGDEDFRLLPTSPCIDAGNNTETIGVLDLDELPRFIDDPLTVDTGVGEAPIVDMGAFEFTPTLIGDTQGIMTWVGTNGQFLDPTNWFPQRIPGSTDIALFNVENEVTVSVNSSVTLDSIIITSGEVKLQIPSIDVLVTSFIHPIRIFSYGNESELNVSGEGGRLIITNGSIVIGGEDDDDDFDDVLEVEDGAELVIGLLRILDGGQFVGGVGNANITAEVRNTGGTIDPSGLEPGLLTLTGDYSAIPQDSTDPNMNGSVIFTFDESTASPYTYDQISITGSAQLGGVLGLQFNNNFSTVVGDLYGIISAGALSGTFDTVWSTGLPSNQYGGWLRTSGIRGTGGATIGSGNPITFAAPISTPLSGEPTGIVIADFDGINGVDVALSIPNIDPLLSGTVSILLNNGVSGGVWLGFTASPLISVGVNPIDIDVADLDSDGDSDLVVANFTDSTITTLFNDGSATFTSTTITTGIGPTTIAIANYVEDGLFLDDIAVGCSSFQPIIAVLQNQSTPGLVGSSFTWMNSISVPNPADILPGDVTNDKDFDYVLLNSLGDTVSVLEGDGNGDLLPQPPGFNPGTNLPANSSAISQSFSDLNNDGFDDLVTVNNGDGSISILRSTGNSLDVPSTIPVGTFPESLAMSDLDNDGDVDLIVSVIGGTSLVRELLIARNDTTDPLTITLTDIGTPQASGFVPTYVQTGDFNNDGLQDIVSITETVLLTGHTSPAATTMLNTTSISCPEDFDNNGTVAVADLLTLIAAWGNVSGAEDLNADGIVNVADLLILIAAWGAC